MSLSSQHKPDSLKTIPDVESPMSDDEIPDHVFESHSDSPDCEICGRDVETEVHHLTPKDRKSSETADVCEACHRQIHAVFTNHELRHEYNSPEDIRESERMSEFLGWIRQTDKTRIQVDESRRVRDWRG